MFQQNGLDLWPGNVIAGRDDQIVGPRLIPEITILVPQIAVPGHVPAVLHVAGLAFRIGHIAATGGSAHGQTADLARRHRATVFIQHRGLETGDGQTSSTGADFVVASGNKGIQHFRGADSVVNAQSGLGMPIIPGRLGQSFSSRITMPQTGQAVPVHQIVHQGHQRAVHGGGGVQYGNAVFFDRGNQAFGRIAVHQQRRCARMQGKE